MGTLAKRSLNIFLANDPKELLPTFCCYCYFLVIAGDMYIINNKNDK